MHYLVPNWCHCQRIFSRLKLSAATRQGHVGDVSVFAEWHSLCWFFALPLSPRSALIPSQWDVLLEQSALSTTELRCGFQRPIWVLPSRNWGFDGAQIQPDVAPLPLWPTQTGFTRALKPQCRSSIDQGVDSKPFPLDRAFKSGYFHRFFVSGDVITPVPPLPPLLFCAQREWKWHLTAMKNHLNLSSTTSHPLVSPSKIYPRRSHQSPCHGAGCNHSHRSHLLGFSGAMLFALGEMY